MVGFSSLWISQHGSRGQDFSDKRMTQRKQTSLTELLPFPWPVFVQHDAAWLYHTVWNLKTTSLMWTRELLSRWLLAAEGSREAESKGCGAWKDWCIMEKNISPVPWHHRGLAQSEEPDWNLSSGGNTDLFCPWIPGGESHEVDGWSRFGANGSASRPEKAKSLWSEVLKHLKWEDSEKYQGW